MALCTFNLLKMKWNTKNYNEILKIINEILKIINEILKIINDLLLQSVDNNLKLIDNFTFLLSLKPHFIFLII